MPTRFEAARRHAKYYADLLFTADQFFQQGGEFLEQGLGLFDQEWDNIQLGHAWAAANSDTDRAATQLCAEYPERGAYCLNLRQKPEERIRWLEVAIVAARRLEFGYVEGNLLAKLGLAYADAGDPHKAVKLYGQRLQIAQRLGDQSGLIEGLTDLGIILDQNGESERAIRLHEQALELARRSGERRAEGSIVGNLGMAYASLGQWQGAVEFHQQHLEIARTIGDRRGEGNALANLGIAYCKLNEPRRAIECFSQSLVINRILGDQRAEGQDLGNLGLAYEALGDFEQAGVYHRRRLHTAEQINDRRGVAIAHWNLGLTLLRLGDHHQALEHLEAAIDLERELGDPAAEQDAAHFEMLRSQLASQLQEWR